MYIPGIEAFLEIVRTQSMNKAAENLHVSQSTISHRLKTLEDELGHMLVERSKGVAAVHLTSAGEAFITIAERLQLLQEEMDYLKLHGPKTSLAIGAADSLNHYVLPPFYRSICKQPDLSIQISIHNSWELYTLLEAREITVGFVAMEMVRKNISIKPFYKDEQVLLCRAGSCIDEATVAAMQLKTDDELLVNLGPAFHEWHDQWWSPSRPARIRLTSYSTLASLLSEPQQWSIVPLSMATTLAQTGDFKYYRLPDPPPERTYYIITHKHQEAKTERVLSILNKYVAAIANIG